jgi:hypothetical protein
VKEQRRWVSIAFAKALDMEELLLQKLNEIQVGREGGFFAKIGDVGGILLQKLEKREVLQKLVTCVLELLQKLVMWTGHFCKSSTRRGVVAFAKVVDTGEGLLQKIAGQDEAFSKDMGQLCKSQAQGMWDGFCEWKDLLQNQPKSGDVQGRT